MKYLLILMVVSSLGAVFAECHYESQVDLMTGQTVTAWVCTDNNPTDPTCEYVPCETGTCLVCH